MYSKYLLKGTLQPIILSLLSEKGKMYGYEITQMVKEITKGKIAITEGALYPMLHRPSALFLIRSKMYDGDERSLYRIYQE